MPFHNVHFSWAYKGFLDLVLAEGVKVGSVSVWVHGQGVCMGDGCGLEFLFNLFLLGHFLEIFETYFMPPIGPILEEGQIN